MHGSLLFAEEISDAARVMRLSMVGLHSLLGLLFFTMVLLRLRTLLRHSLYALALVNIALGLGLEKMSLSMVSIAMFAYMLLFALFAVAGMVASWRERALE